MKLALRCKKMADGLEREGARWLQEAIKRDGTAVLAKFCGYASANLFLITQLREFQTAETRIILNALPQLLDRLKLEVEVWEVEASLENEDQATRTDHEDFYLAYCRRLRQVQTQVSTLFTLDADDNADGAQTRPRQYPRRYPVRK